MTQLFETHATHDADGRTLSTTTVTRQGQESSTELHTTAKGEVQIHIKAYHPQTIQTVYEAIECLDIAKEELLKRGYKLALAKQEVPDAPDAL